jgi:hypothetical protein
VPFSRFIFVQHRYHITYFYYDVAYGPVARQRPRNKRRATAVVMQQGDKHAFTTEELLLETAFSMCQCRGVILKTTGAAQLVESQRVKRDYEVGVKWPSACELVISLLTRFLHGRL